MTAPIAPSVPAHLLDRRAALDWFQCAGVPVVSASPDYVRHKPDSSTLVGYVFDTVDGERARGYVRWCADRERAADVARKARSLRVVESPLGSTISMPDPHTVFSPFPNDAALRRLRWYATPRKLKRTLGHLSPDGTTLSGSRTTVEVLRYKPERRVVVAAELVGSTGDRRRVVARYSTTPVAERLAEVAKALLRSGVVAPRPIDQLEGGYVVVDEFVDGVELRTAIGVGGVGGDGGVDVDAVAEAIGRFHQCSVPSMPRTTYDDELQRALTGLAGLVAVQPESSALAERLRLLLVARWPETTSGDGLLHGDLHDRNVMVGPSGEIVFVDLERSAIGPAAVDLGRLRGAARGLSVRRPGEARNAIEASERIVESYIRRCGTSAIAHALAWTTATALVDQAVLVVRQLEPGWAVRSITLLEAALDMVGEARS